MSAVLICVSAGRGPAECRLAVARVVEAMTAEAVGLGLHVAAEGNPAGDRPSVMLSIDGDGVDGFLRGWEGSARVVAQSTLRPNHPRRNWFVGVHRFSPAAVPIALEPADLVYETMRAGGPGGQHQNRTESAVRVTHRPSGASAVARDQRSQHRNRAVALERLQAVLAGVQSRERDRQAFREWLARIAVERGNPVRTLP